MNPDDPDHAQLQADLEACEMERKRLERNSYKPLAINRDIAMLHPAVREQFRRLEAICVNSNYTRFRLFEGWRSPLRQQALFRQTPPVTKAAPWESLHQYGLAADFVWQDEQGMWSWHQEHPWDVLGEFAEMVGLVVPIKWDKPHVEAKWGRDLNMWIRTHGHRSKMEAGPV